MANDKKKKKFELRSSPPGVLVYPRVVTPDFKFKKVEGQFSTKLKLEGEAAEKFRDQCDKWHRDAFAEIKAELAAGDGKRKAAAKKLQLGKPPYEPEVDDDGNETGAIVFKFSRTASGVSKQTGKPWKAKIRLFDAKGKPIQGVDPWGGTVARVGFFTKPYYVPASDQAGVSLKLDAIKILELVSQGERAASEYGFGEEEEGFDGSAVETPAVADDTDDDADEDATSGEPTNEGGDDDDPDGEDF